MLIKKDLIAFQKLGSQDFWRIANSVLNKGKSAIPPLFNNPEVLSCAYDKAKLFAENFSKNLNLDDSGICLLVKCLKESCFSDYWKVSSVVPVFKSVG